MLGTLEEQMPSNNIWHILSTYYVLGNVLSPLQFIYSCNRPREQGLYHAHFTDGKSETLKGCPRSYNHLAKLRPKPKQSDSSVCDPDHRARRPETRARLQIQIWDP